MARRVFLHIGTPKSGTTYLQERVALNRDLIARQGLTYPTTRTGDHFEAALDLIEEPWAGQREVARGQWAALVAEARRTSGDVLISHEILAAASPAQIARVMNDFAQDQVHVVLTVRDLARQIPAEWQEMVKHRGRRTFHNFMKDVAQGARTRPTLWFWRVQSLPDILTRWSNGLPPEQVHVVVVPTPGTPSDVLWRRFAEAVRLDPDAAYQEGTVSNASLGVAEAAVVRKLNRLLEGRGVSREVYIDLVRELIARDTLGSREGAIQVYVPQARWPFIDRVTAEWIDWLEGSGVDVIGDLDDLRPEPPGPDHLWVHPDRPPSEDVAEAAVEALAAVVAQASPTDPSRVRRLARRLLGG